MVQPKYNPQEALERIKLMMSYDVNKTLTENRKSTSSVGFVRINEQQSSSCPYQVDPSVVANNGYRLASLIKYLGTLVVRMAYLEERTSEVLQIIKDTARTNIYNESTNTCENALVRLEKEFMLKHDDYWSEGESLPIELQDLIDNYFDGGGTVSAKEKIQLAKKIFQENVGKPAGTSTTSGTGGTGTSGTGGTGTSGTGGTGTSGTGGTVTPSRYTPCSGKYYRGCKSPVIAKVQGCLDITADGKWGKITQQTITTKFPQFTNYFTDEDVSKICSTEPPQPTVVKPDIGGTVNIIDVTNTDF